MGNARDATALEHSERGMDSSKEGFICPGTAALPIELTRDAIPKTAFLENPQHGATAQDASKSATW
jgi:hypothetical protein